MVYIYCQLDRMQNLPGNKSLGMYVRGCLNQANGNRKTQAKCGWHPSMGQGPRLHKQQKESCTGEMVSLPFLTEDATCPAALLLLPTCLPIMMHYILLHCKPEQTLPSFLPLPLWLFCQCDKKSNKYRGLKKSLCTGVHAYVFVCVYCIVLYVYMACLHVYMLLSIEYSEMHYSTSMLCYIWLLHQVVQQMMDMVYSLCQKTMRARREGLRNNRTSLTALNISTRE